MLFAVNWKVSRKETGTCLSPNEWWAFSSLWSLKIHIHSSPSGAAWWWGAVSQILWYGLKLSLCLVRWTLISQLWRMLWLLPRVTVFKETVPLGAVIGDGMKGACKNSTRMYSVPVSWVLCPLSMYKELQLTQGPAQVPGNSCTNPHWLACRPSSWVEDVPPSVVEYLPP